MAQMVEHILGKDEVTGSSPVISSKDRDAQSPLSFFMPKNEKRTSTGDTWLQIHL